HDRREDDEDQVQRELRLGAWISNSAAEPPRSRPSGVELLSAIGMRWDIAQGVRSTRGGPRSVHRAYISRTSPALSVRVPFTYRVPGRDAKAVRDVKAVEAEGWPATLSAFPLGQWIADARRFYARGRLDPDRIAQLEKRRRPGKKASPQPAAD
ncbi:Helicase associated domain protein, partial [Streptomyces cinerochromogenes]|uniref:helicase associated domain-containing protein n=1 Tax=Streptomyces cinerochromogenes TaxID=66422 RepID=UPI003F541990